MSKKRLREIYRDLFHSIDRNVKLSKASPRQGCFNLCLRASFVKLLEFNEFINSTTRQDTSFFYMATLRGICEDFIVLKYLSQMTRYRKDKLILLMASKQSEEAIRAQSIFFTRNDRTEVVLMRPKAESKEVIDSLTKSISKILQRENTGRSRNLPPVRDMAQHVELLDLYDYLYHATSKTVHFSPHILMRMAWGDVEEGEFEVSTKHFYPYYKDFNIFCASFLFVRFVDQFRRNLRLKKSILESRNEVNQILK